MLRHCATSARGNLTPPAFQGLTVRHCHEQPQAAPSSGAPFPVRHGVSDAGKTVFRSMEQQHFATLRADAWGGL